MRPLTGPDSWFRPKQEPHSPSLAVREPVAAAETAWPVWAPGTAGARGPRPLRAAEGDPEGPCRPHTLVARGRWPGRRETGRGAAGVWMRIGFPSAANESGVLNLFIT